jgi:hypothetical protein
MADQPLDQPPDRLCIDPESPFYNEAVLERGVGVRFKGRERDDVEEYCVSEGWIRAPVGKTRDRKGNLLTIRLTGPVEPYYLTPSNKPESLAVGCHGHSRFALLTESDAPDR